MHTAELCVAGPGAIGGLLASRWARLGLRVALLGRDGACERRAARGWRIEQHCSRAWRARRGLEPAAESPGPMRAVFLTVKSYSLDSVLGKLPRLLGPDTAIVSLINGIRHVEPIRRRFGSRRTVMGVVFIAASRPRPGVIRHGNGEDIFLARGPRNEDAAETARRLLEAAGWKVHVLGDENRLLWTKLVFNAATNPLGAIYRAPNHRLRNDPVLRRMLERAAEEARRVAEANGTPPLDGLIPVLRKKGSNPAHELPNSMLQDLDSGRPTEARSILGPILQAARRHGVETPLLRLLADRIRRLEASPRASVCPCRRFVRLERIL